MKYLNCGMNLLESLAVNSDFHIFIILEQPQASRKPHRIDFDGTREPQRGHELLSTLATHSCFRDEHHIRLYFAISSLKVRRNS